MPNFKSRGCITILILALSFNWMESQPIPLDSLTVEYLYGRSIENVIDSMYKAKENDSKWEFHYHVAQYYSQINTFDSAAHNFERTLNMVSDSTELDTITERCLFELGKYALNSNHIKQTEYFIREIEKLNVSHKQKCYQNYYSNYLRARLQMQKKNYDESLEILLKINEDSYCLHKYDQWRINTLIAKNYWFKSEFQKSKEYHFRCLKITNETLDKDNILFFSFFNISNFFYQEGQLDSALYYLDRSEKSPLSKYKFKTLKILYQRKSEILERLGRHESANSYLKAYLSIAKVIDEVSYDIAVHNLETRYAVAQKDAQINQLQMWKTTYDHNKYWIAASLLFIFGLSVYSYIRWKRSDQQKALVSAEKSLLEAEHQKVQQEINKVKELVIKDHIVLKNKAKVLVTDLLYIKSEDHYLRLQTAHGEEFVRGTLSALIEELPPNFVRCHRSYIVNLNAISQFRSNDVVLTSGDVVSVSRKYKDNIDNFL